MGQVVGSNNSYKPITNTAWVRAQLCKLQKGCTRLAAASDRVTIPVQLVHGRWFSPGTPASSTTKTGRHDIAEISLKVALKHQQSNQSIKSVYIQTEYTVHRHKYSSPSIFYYIFHINPHLKFFFLKLSLARFL